MARVDRQNAWSLRVSAKEFQLKPDSRGRGEILSLELGRPGTQEAPTLGVWPDDEQEVPDLDVWAGVKKPCSSTSLTCNLGQ